MNWKQLLTNPFKKKVYPNLIPKKPENETFPAMMTPEDAVKALPDEMLANLKGYKSTKFNNTKFTEDQQLELMEFIARYATIDEINSHFMSKYRQTISQNLVYQYRRTQKWKPIIKKLREKYLGNTDDVAISHKRVRLDRAEHASQLAMKKNDSRAIIAANADAREEVVGKSPSIGSVNMQFNGMSYEEIQDYKKELMAKLSKTIEIKPQELK